MFFFQCTKQFVKNLHNYAENCPLQLRVHSLEIREQPSIIVSRVVLLNSIKDKGSLHYKLYIGIFLSDICG